MPIIKSAIKRMRQTMKRRARNVATKRNLHAALKAFTNARATSSLQAAQSEIDKAVKKNLLSKNAAARKKAKLAKIAKEAGVKLTASNTAAPKPTAPAKKTTTAKKPAAKKPAAKKAK